MGRSPCCDKVGLKKGPWTPEEDRMLIEYIQNHGHNNWKNLPKSAGLNRCGKSCRLRWTNYLRPDIKHGMFSVEEERLIIHLHSVLGNKWSAIATRLSGRTDNEIKNYWNTHIRKKLLLMGIDPVTHRRRTDLELLANLPTLLGASANLDNLPPSWDNMFRLQADAADIARLQILQSLVQTINPYAPPSIDSMNQLGSAAPIQSYHFNDLIQLSRQHEGLDNGSLSLPQSAIQTTMALTSSGTQPLVTNFQTFCESSFPQEDQEMVSSLLKDDFVNQMHSSYMVPTANSSAPSLVSASPENVITDHMEDWPIKSNNASPNSSASTQFDSWEGQELGDVDTDLSWKDILDQISWSSAQ